MVYVFLAKGFEEIEALTVVDCLRRAEVETCTVGIGGKIIAGSHNIPVFCDLDESEISLDEGLEAVVLPGGMPGTVNLEANSSVRSAVEYCCDGEIPVCAICAAPSILGHMGLLKGKKACCFPGFENELHGACIVSDFVCEDGNIITAKGMGSALLFSHSIIAKLRDVKTADRIIDSLQCPV